MSNNPHPGNQSEVARLREQIALEHAAASAALVNLASGTARHDFISSKMDRIGDHQQRLARLIGEQESMDIVCKVFDQ